VLAAAVRGGADTLVTFNVTDFPPKSVEDHGVEVVHPDLFLAGCWPNARMTRWRSLSGTLVS
jgi:hypothetical protein